MAITLLYSLFRTNWYNGKVELRPWHPYARFLANPTSDFITIFTAMFMHAGWLHILSNMLYLSVFGDNVEDRFGHLKFLVFYLICGVVATFVQIAFTRNSDVPTLGASGAIAGVLAAYVFMLPSSQSGACRKSKVKGRVLPGSTSDPDTH